MLNAPGAVRHQKCFLHLQREAVARCPQCGRFYCRECVTEHEDRLLCAACLAKVTASGKPSRARLRVLLLVFEFLAGFLICWLCFYYAGRWLVSLPDSFHQGTLWEDTGHG